MLSPSQRLYPLGRSPLLDGVEPAAIIHMTQPKVLLNPQAWRAYPPGRSPLRDGVGLEANISFLWCPFIPLNHLLFLLFHIILLQFWDVIFCRYEKAGQFSFFVFDKCDGYPFFVQGRNFLQTIFFPLLLLLIVVIYSACKISISIGAIIQFLLVARPISSNSKSSI